MKKYYRVPAAVWCALCLAPPVNAFDWSVSGFIREEIAWQIPGDGHNNIWNTTTRNDNSAHKYPNAFLDWVAGPLAPPNFFSRKDFHSDPDWNLLATRVEIDLAMTFTPRLSGSVKARGYYMIDVNDGYRFKPNPEGWINEDVGRPNNFEVDFYGGNAGGPFEISHKDWMADLASAYVDYLNGPLWLRVGHQQIAWGEALFFRVADVANGLDLRRHLVLDFGLEEYADERQASPGIRLNYTFNQTWAIDLFAQMFRPTTLPGVNSPYNVIPGPIHVFWGDGFDKVKDNINGGVRLMGTFGDFGATLFAVSRHNPDPILALVPTGQVHPGLPGVETVGFGAVNVPGARRQPGEGILVSQDEWFKLSSRIGIDGIEVVNGLAAEDPIVESLVAAVLLPKYGVRNGENLVFNMEDTAYVLGAFQAVLGELYATVAPTYAAENVFGGSVNYINYAEPDTIFDQLVTRFEISYTPDKKFTTNGRDEFYQHDEFAMALIMEKYHRFSNEFPATFFVFQWMHKTESNLLGMPLKWQGGETTRQVTGGERDNGWDAVVLAAVQPFPNAIWQTHVAFLYDLDGGYLFSPGVKYKASEALNFDLYANIINAWDTAASLQPIEWADEIVARITYQF